jgi:hypothetical protein
MKKDTKKNDSAAKETTVLKTKSGFGGLLILPLIGFVLTPVKFLYVLYTCVISIHALAIPLNRTILVLDVLSVLVDIVLFIQFLQKKKIAPAFYIFYRLLWIVAAIGIYVGSIGLPLTQASNLELATDFFGSIVGAMIFVPYFLFSKRVNATFVNEPSDKSFFDKIVKPITPVIAGFAGFLRKTKLFVILLILGYAVLTAVAAIAISAL